MASIHAHLKDSTSDRCVSILLVSLASKPSVTNTAHWLMLQMIQASDINGEGFWHKYGGRTETQWITSFIQHKHHWQTHT